MSPEIIILMYRKVTESIFSFYIKLIFIIEIFVSLLDNNGGKWKILKYTGMSIRRQTVRKCKIKILRRLIVD